MGTDSKISVSALSLAAGQAYKLQFTNGTAAKAEGSVLVLDVGSLWQKHPADPPFGIATAAECQQRCAVLPGACQHCEDHRLDLDLSQQPDAHALHVFVPVTQRCTVEALGGPATTAEM